jgi:hypothetical protein
MTDPQTTISCREKTILDSEQQILDTNDDHAKYEKS